PSAPAPSPALPASGVPSHSKRGKGVKGKKGKGALPHFPLSRFPLSPRHRIGFVLSDFGHPLSIFNNFFAFVWFKNPPTERLLRTVRQQLRLLCLPLRLGGASRVLLLCLPVELQRPAQLTLVLGLLAHQVQIGVIAGGQAHVALIGGDFHELPVVKLVEAQNA